MLTTRYLLRTAAETEYFSTRDDVLARVSTLLHRETGCGIYLEAYPATSGDKPNRHTDALDPNAAPVEPPLPPSSMSLLERARDRLNAEYTEAA